MVGKSAPPRTKNGIIIPEGVIFYYVRNGKNQPIACVALASNVESGLAGDYWCRGVSICSPNDQFNRKDARRIAYGRLCKAFGTGESSDPILPNDRYYRGRDTWVDDRLTFVRKKVGITDKVGWDVDLTEFEQKLVEKVDNGQDD